MIFLIKRGKNIGKYRFRIFPNGAGTKPILDYVRPTKQDAIDHLNKMMVKYPDAYIYEPRCGFKNIDTITYKVYRTKWGPITYFSIGKEIMEEMNWRLGNRVNMFVWKDIVCMEKNPEGHYKIKTNCMTIPKNAKGTTGIIQTKYNELLGFPFLTKQTVCGDIKTYTLSKKYRGRGNAIFFKIPNQISKFENPKRIDKIKRRNYGNV